MALDKKLSNKETTFGLLNSAITLCNNFPTLSNVNSLVTTNLNPFDYLLNIYFLVGDKDKLLKWLSVLLTYSLPIIELAIKGILLSNLKNMISCSLDPRIPDEMRLDLNDIFGSSTNDRKGIIFSMSNIDIFDMLTISPFTEIGKTMYFGGKTAASPFEFLRADDFNSFLWLIFNKKTFLSPININNVDVLRNQNLLKAFNINNQDFVIGTTYKYDEPNILSMCIKSNNGLSSFVPFSFENTSANWYVNRKQYFDFFIPKDKREPRNYSEEFPIINVKAFDSTNTNIRQVKIAVLPKPFVHLPHNGEPTWRIKRILFDSDGNPNIKGKYTIQVNNLNGQDNGDVVIYNIKQGGILEVNKSTGEYQIKNADPQKVLFECYPGLTIYEFNYDFVMGMKLFDPEVVAKQLINSVINIQIGMPVVTKNTILGREKIVEIVSNIIESYNTENDDCMWSFSNDKYNAMLERSEILKSNNYKFQGSNEANYIDIDSILKPMEDFSSENATLEENINIMTHTFNQMSFAITEGIDGVDSYNLEVNIVKQLIANLVSTLINGLLSPKILILFEVNKYMLGMYNDKFKFSIEEFLQSIWNIIYAIIKEVCDLILKELLQMVLKELEPLIACITSQVIQEQVDQYRRLIETIIKTCTFQSKKSDLDTQLDTIYGADITTPNPEEPKDNNCT